jgi:hypothetical protein
VQSALPVAICAVTYHHLVQYFLQHVMMRTGLFT